jgi:hypothetical protein
MQLDRQPPRKAKPKPAEDNEEFQGVQLMKAQSS